MNGITLEEVTFHTNLGLTISNNMQWNAHIDKAITKASKRLFHLRRLQYVLPRSALITIYLTMIRPILEYGDVIYDNLPIYLSQKLENVQRRAALICTGAYRHTEHTTLLRELGWDLLSTRRYYRRLTVYYTLINGPTPNHIKPHLPDTVSASTPYNLRNSSNLRPPPARLTSSYKSFFPQTSRDWNSLPIKTRASLSKYSFKKAIKTKRDINPYTTTHHGKCGAWISRIRMGLSGLNAHRFTYNLSNTPLCSLCHLGNENTIHYLWDCPAHNSARKVVIERILAETSIEQVTRANITSLLINGEIEKEFHQTLFKLTSEFITSTERFK
jgi:hypothetical protein